MRPYREPELVPLRQVRVGVELPKAMYKSLAECGGVDPDLVELYDVLRNNLIVDLDASGHRMRTSDHLLVERIAFAYVSMKTIEAGGGYSSGTEQRNLNSLFQTMMQDYNKLLGRDDDERWNRQQERLVSAVKKATEGLSKEERTAVIRAVSEQLSVAAA